VLKVDVATLTGQPFRLGPNGGPELDQTDAIRRAILAYHGPADEPRSGVELDAIERAVNEAQVHYQQAHYAQVGRLAPLLIRQAEAAAKSTQGPDERRAQALLASTYHLVTAVLSRCGDTSSAGSPPTGPSPLHNGPRPPSSSPWVCTAWVM
jgi:hypothetical protein